MLGGRGSRAAVSFSKAAFRFWEMVSKSTFSRYSFGREGVTQKSVYALDNFDNSGRPLKPGLHSVRRMYANEMRKRIYASHARRGVYTPRVDLGAYTQTSTQYRLRTISGRWICCVKACVYAEVAGSTLKRRRIVGVFTLGTCEIPTA